MTPLGRSVLVALAAAGSIPDLTVAQGVSPPPGRAHLFVLDLAGTPVGEFPTTIKQLKGSLEVALKDGVPMLKASVTSEFLITLPQGLPGDFTVEFDLVPKPCCNPSDLSFEGTPTINQGAGSAHVLWDSDGYLAIIGGGGTTYEAPMPEDLRATLPGVLTHVVAVIQGPTIRLYTNGRRHYTLDKHFARGRVLRVTLGVDLARQDPVHLAGLRILAGAFPPTAGIAVNPAPPPGQPAPPPGQPAPPPQTTSSPATGTGSTVAAAPSQLGRAPSGSPVPMNDGPTPLGYGVDRINPGTRIKWTQPVAAVSFSVCRVIAPGNCPKLTPTPVPLQPGTDAFFVDQDVVPGSSNAYQLTTTRADGHFGVLGFNATAGRWPAPGNFRVIQDLSAQGELIIGWDPVGYLKQDNTPAVLSTYIVTGTGISTIQVVGTQVRVPLSSGANSWQVAPAYPNSAGGFFTSDAPATLSYDYGRYRLIALGVRALKQSADDLLDMDGRADEIYVAAVSHVTTRTFGSGTVANARSTTYGDVGTANAFVGRVQAGTAGPRGGIRTGDLVPIGLNLSAPTGTPNSAGFPLLLWEGALDANAMVVVFPTIWEDDNNKGPHGGWVSHLQTFIGSNYNVGTLLAEIGALRDADALGPWSSGGWFRCIDPLSGNVNSPQVCTHAGRDRPIGLRSVVMASTDEILDHRVIVLTRSAIEKALAGPSPNVGAAPGVIVVSLQETGPISTAMYELYLRVERMP